MPGITHCPRASIVRATSLGTVVEAAGPAATIRSPRMTMIESGTGALP
jgi:hypothetical protein